MNFNYFINKKSLLCVIQAIVFVVIPVCSFSNEKIQLTLQQAISETLNNQWDIFISKMEIQNQEGFYQSSKGPFDPILTLTGQQMWGKTWSSQLGVDLGEGNTFIVPGVGTFVSHEPGGIEVNLLTTTVTGGLTKKSRFGTSFSVQTSVSRSYNPLDVLSSGYSGIKPYVRTATALISVTIDQPFLKGFLNSKETMDEKSQQLQVQSTKCSFINEVSQQVLDTIEAYWDLIRAHKLLKAYKESEKQNQIFTNDVQALIDKNQVPKSQLSQPLRDLSSAKASVSSTEQDIISSAQRLAIAMGAPEKYVLYCDQRLLLDEFPLQQLYERIPCYTVTKEATQFAIMHRFDLLSLDYNRRAAAMQVKGTFNETLPSLNLELQGTDTNQTYGDGAKSVFSSYDLVAPQRELSIEVSLDFPIFRDYGKGQYRSAKAVKKQADLKYERLKSEIVTSVIEAVNNHNSLITELADVNAAVQEANIYVQQEKTLYKAGMTSLFELLDSHSNQVQQQIRKIEIETMYFQNIAKIHYLLGLIVTGDPLRGNIQIKDVTSLPQELWLQMLGSK